MTEQQNTRAPTPALHQKIFARAIATDKEDGTNWTAIGLVDAGILLLSDSVPTSDEAEPDPGEVMARLVEYGGSGAALMFALTAEQRTALGMSDAVYQELNVGLKMSEAKLGSQGKAGAGKQGQQQQRGGAQGNRR